MTSLDYVAQKMDEYSEKSIEMTPRRVRALGRCLKVAQEIAEINSGMKYGVDRVRFRPDDLELVGEMDFLLEHFYPDGNVPEQLRGYQNFVNRIKGIDSYHDTLEAKLQRDERNLAERDSVAEADDLSYARAIVDVVEADEVTPEKSRLLISFEGQELYEENLPNYAFAGLPEKATVVFEYTSQGLSLDLKRTLEESSRAKADPSKVEKSVIDSLAIDAQTKSYVDSVYDQINEELSE